MPESLSATTAGRIVDVGQQSRSQCCQCLLAPPVPICVSQRDSEDTRIDMDLPSAFFSKFPEMRPSSVPALLDENLIKGSSRMPLLARHYGIAAAACG
jgi:hypothetical protein